MEIIGSSEVHWFNLTIEQVGNFDVRANSPDAAWLKLNYYCAELALAGDLQYQFDLFQKTDESVNPILQAHHERLYASDGRSIILRGFVEFNPSSIKHWPEHRDWLIEQEELAAKRAHLEGTIFSAPSPRPPYSKC